MESIKKVKMMIDLENFFEINKRIKIRTRDRIIEGFLMNYEKGFVAEMFFDPQSGEEIDAPDMITKITIKSIDEGQILEISFREILKFEAL